MSHVKLPRPHGLVPRNQTRQGLLTKLEYYRTEAFDAGAESSQSIEGCRHIEAVDSESCEDCFVV